MLTSILRALGFSAKEERRQHERFNVSSPLEVTIDGSAYKCIVDNVSVGGLRVEPPVEAEIGAVLKIFHPNSGLQLVGRLVGHDGNGSRISFNSEEAGAVVSVWVRMMHEQTSEAAPAG